MYKNKYSRKFIAELKKLLPEDSIIVKKALNNKDISREIETFVEDDNTDPCIARRVWDLYEDEILRQDLKATKDYFNSSEFQQFKTIIN